VSAHTHTDYVPGCFRCELARDEITGLTNTTEREWQAWCAGYDQGYEDRKAEDS